MKDTEKRGLNQVMKELACPSEELGLYIMDNRKPLMVFKPRRLTHITRLKEISPMQTLSCKALWPVLGDRQCYQSKYTWEDRKRQWPQHRSQQTLESKSAPTPPQQTILCSELSFSPQWEMRDKTKNQNHKQKGHLGKLGTYSSVSLHPGINELSGSIGYLEETWIRLSQARNGTGNPQDISFVRLRHHSLKIKGKCVQTFNPYKIRNPVSPGYREGFMFHSLFLAEFLPWLNPHSHMPHHLPVFPYLDNPFSLLPRNSLQDMALGRHRLKKDYSVQQII